MKKTPKNSIVHYHSLTKKNITHPIAKTTQHKKPIDDDYWLKICTKIVMLIKTSDKRKLNEF